MFQLCHFLDPQCIPRVIFEKWHDKFSQVDVAFSELFVGINTDYLELAESSDVYKLTADGLAQLQRSSRYELPKVFVQVLDCFAEVIVGEVLQNLDNKQVFVKNAEYIFDKIEEFSARKDVGKLISVKNLDAENLLSLLIINNYIASVYIDEKKYTEAEGVLKRSHRLVKYIKKDTNDISEYYSALYDLRVRLELGKNNDKRKLERCLRKLFRFYKQAPKNHFIKQTDIEPHYKLAEFLLKKGDEGSLSEAEKIIDQVICDYKAGKVMAFNFQFEKYDRLKDRIKQKSGEPPHTSLVPCHELIDKYQLCLDAIAERDSVSANNYLDFILARESQFLNLGDQLENSHIKLLLLKIQVCSICDNPVGMQEGVQKLGELGIKNLDEFFDDLKISPLSLGIQFRYQVSNLVLNYDKKFFYHNFSRLVTATNKQTLSRNLEIYGGYFSGKKEVAKKYLLNKFAVDDKKAIRWIFDSSSQQALLGSYLDLARALNVTVMRFLDEKEDDFMKRVILEIQEKFKEFDFVGLIYGDLANRELMSRWGLKIADDSHGIIIATVHESLHLQGFFGFEINEVIDAQQVHNVLDSRYRAQFFDYSQLTLLIGDSIFYLNIVIQQTDKLPLATPAEKITEYFRGFCRSYPLRSKEKTILQTNLLKYFLSSLSEAASYCLKFLVYFSPIDTPFAYLKELLQKKYPDKVFEQVLGELDALLVIQPNSVMHGGGLMRLGQPVIDYFSSTKIMSSHVIEQDALVFSMLGKMSQEVNELSEIKILLQHVEKFVKTQHDSYFLLKLGIKLYIQGLYLECIQLLQQITFKDQYLELFRTCYLGLAYHDCGRHPQNEFLANFHRLLDVSQDLGVEEQHICIGLCNKLSHYYCTSGDAEYALGFSKKASALINSIPGYKDKNPEDVMENCNQSALALLYLNRPDEAKIQLSYAPVVKVESGQKDVCVINTVALNISDAMYYFVKAVNARVNSMNYLNDINEAGIYAVKAFDKIKDHPARAVLGATACALLSNICIENGDYDMAIRYSRQGMHYAAKFQGRYHYRLCECEMNLVCAKIYLYVKNPDAVRLEKLRTSIKELAAHALYLLEKNDGLKQKILNFCPQLEQATAQHLIHIFFKYSAEIIKETVGESHPYVQLQEKRLLVIKEIFEEPVVFDVCEDRSNGLSVPRLGISAKA